MKLPYRYLLVFIALLISRLAIAQQQDVVFHLNSTLLSGKTILKIKHDFHDTYLWVLAKNNEVYRVNTATLAVDNYTQQFAVYSSLPFIDIAGRSNDTVFIATSTDQMIQLEGSSLSLVNFQGNTLNSVGVDYTGRLTGGYSNVPYGNALLVGTTNGLYRYDMDANTSVLSSDAGPSRVFEATYRRDMYSVSPPEVGDTVTLVPVVFANPSTVYSGYTWLNSTTFGTNLKTAFYTPYSYTDDDYVYGGNIFWGTERGLFQNNWNYSYSSASQDAQYLNNIPVNKVTDIFGLTAFGSTSLADDIFGSNTGLVRQNLLVGTDQGFYYNSSLLDNFQTQSDLRNFTLFHYDELGTVRVNDICVNNESIVWPTCEDGVWVACDNGLYLLKPDYAQFLNSKQLDAAVFENYDDNVSSIKICSGTTATAQITVDAYSGNSFQWYKDGQEIAGSSMNSLLINTSGDYYAVLYDPCQNVHIETNHLQVQVIAAPVFSFNYPDQLQYCDSTQTTLKTDNDPVYSYRWYTNGVLNGVTTYNYTVTQSGKYKVEVSACSNSWVPSKEIEVDLIDLPIPAVAADKTQYCQGETAQLTVGVPTDPSYTINWYNNGNIIAAYQNQTSISVTADGSYSAVLSSTIANCTKASNTQQVAFTPAPIYTFNYPDKLTYCSSTPVTLTATGSNTYQYRWYTNSVLNGNTSSTENITQSGKYKVEVSSCENSWVSSKEVQVDLITIQAPVIKTDKASYCVGDNATMSVAVPTDPSYTINWYKDNTLLSSYQNQTSFSTNVAGNYTVVLTATETNTDGTTCTQTSAAQTITFNPLPTVSIQQIVTTTLCDGQTVDLKVVYNNGKVSWSNGQSADQITVSTSGTYTATVTTIAGCNQSVDINVQFFPNPVLNLPNTGVCVPSHKTATITAPAGMVSYTWNGQPGIDTYIADHPQTITLTITDANGCQATQDIQVTDECPNISIPNTFTPNGDGINDTWDIEGLAYDPTALIRIFTRYGQQVYESRGYPKSWDGTFQGKKLPSGVYYYIINAKNNSQTYSGSVTIIY